MHARRVVVLPHRVQAEPEILDAADPLRAVDGAALGGRQDLAARHVDHGHAHLGVELRHDAGLPALHALEVGEVLDRPLNQPSACGLGGMLGNATRFSFSSFW